MPDKAVVHTSAVGKTLPAGYDRSAALAHWPRWSLGIRVANLLFASGTGGSEADGRLPDDPRRQGELAMRRLLVLMEAGGARPDDLVSVRVYLDDPAHSDALLDGLESVLRDHPGGRPAFTMVQANTSDPSVHAEIEAFAATAHESVHCAAVAPAGGPTRAAWADAVRVGNLWFLSGQLPVDRAGLLVDTDPATQARRVLANLSAVLAECGRTPADLARLTVWIADADAVPPVVEATRRFLAEVFTDGTGPATTVVVSPLTEPGARVAMEAVAATGPRRTIGGPAPRAGGLWAVRGVGVELSPESDSFVRRFTWPDGPPGADPGTTPAHRPLGEIVFLSAQTGTGPDGSLVSTSMAGQARQALENMRAVVEEAGGCFADIVQFDVYYADRSLYADYNAERIAYLERHNPGSAWFAGSGPKARSPLPGALIEIESIAVIQ